MAVLKELFRRPVVASDALGDVLLRPQRRATPTVRNAQANERRARLGLPPAGQPFEEHDPTAKGARQGNRPFHYWLFRSDKDKKP